MKYILMARFNIINMAALAQVIFQISKEVEKEKLAALGARNKLKSITEARYRTKT